jgi:predicted nucleic acid-binding protein
LIVFVDTSAFVARNARRDPYGEVASRIWLELEETPLVTTNHVVEETLTLLARRIDPALAADMAERIYSSARLDIIYTTHEDEHAALRYFRKFSDQRVSFTDCISFAVMKRHRLNTAFTFDRHFINAGFRVIGLA